MNPDPDPTPDPIPFFTDFKDAKNVIFFFIFFSHNLATGTSSSVFYRIRIPQAQKHAYPADPVPDSDTQHW
jgi:hypothetical protein